MAEDKRSWESIVAPRDAGCGAPASLPAALGCRRSGLSARGCLWWQESSPAGRSCSKQSCSAPPTGAFTLHRCPNPKRSPLYRLSMKPTVPGLPEEPFGLSLKASTPPSRFLWKVEVAARSNSHVLHVNLCVFIPVG